MRSSSADFSRFDVLVVEDNQFVRKLVREVLHGFGVGKVREASHGKQALSEIGRSAPDLIISDWIMAPVDGLTLLRSLRDETQFGKAYIPVIVLSGHATDDYVAQALGEGADSYIVKPFNSATLMAHLLKVSDGTRGVAYLD